MALSAYLFTIEELLVEEHPYNRAPQRAVVEALSRHGAGVYSLMGAGDLLLERMARKLTSVTGDGQHDTRRAKHGPRATYAFDGDLHMTLIWDLCDALGEQAHDLDLDRLATVLMRHDAFAITVTGLTRETAVAASQDLESSGGYLGWMTVDYGNPVQHEIFTLPRFGYLLEGALVFDPWDTDRPEDPYPLDAHPDPWWEGLALASVRYLQGHELNEAGALPDWPEVTLSERGAETAAMLVRRTAPQHLERLAGEIADRQGPAGPWAFEIDTARMPRASHATVDPSKLAGYALNPEHPHGQHKARLFRDVLAITAEDTEFLAAQLKQGLSTAGNLASVRTDEWGVKYHVVTDVTGRNGQVRPVLAAWEVRNGDPPRLITAYLADQGTPSDAPEQNAAIDPTLEGDERWAALWANARSAGERAADQCVPTPVSIDGTWFPGGLEGGAYVTIHDARAGFARWLLREGHAGKIGGRGASVVTYGYDRGKAYAEAFADVLALNGVESDVGEFLT